MNSITTVLLLGGIAFASGSVVRGQIGTDRPSPPSVKEDIDLGLAAQLLTSSAGFTGIAAANQEVTESVVGNEAIPASALSSSGVFAEVFQEGDILQIGLADANTGSTHTFNDVAVSSEAAAGDTLIAVLEGGESAQVTNEGQSIALGGGLPTIAEASSHNSVISKKN